MEYLVTSTSEVVNYQGLREVFHNFFIPASPTEEYLAPLGVAVVKEVVPQPPQHHLAVRNGVVQIGGVWHQSWEYVPMTEQQKMDALPKQSDYVSALEAMYDRTAQTRNYDNRMTCALRAGYPGPFQAEGLAFATWMDTCNFQAYAHMAKVLGGEAPHPTIQELLSMMPEIAWQA